MTRRIDEGFQQFIDDEIRSNLDLVEEEIFRHVGGDSSLDEIASYLIRSGGKRIRPALLIVAYRAVGGEDIQEVVPIAAAIELIHTASLIHDDINDGAELRRGILTTNRKFGEIRALVAGDYLFVKAFQIGGMYPPEVIQMIADACQDLAEGEILQNENLYRVHMDRSVYEEIIRKKTAALIRASLKVGGWLGGATPEQLDALVAFGDCIGTVFQITDDILDVRGEVEKTGKPRGSDIREGQITLPAIRALETLEGADRDELVRLLTHREVSEVNVDRAIDLIERSGAVEYAFEQAERLTEHCVEVLHVLPESEYRDRLELAVETILQRAY
ncbi:MAG TPA: polyprenyl synthetase family protein [Thermoplasmata archaeon]|nr:polyprenyl synthetase family protein [Thermoplasmata archaeon]